MINYWLGILGTVQAVTDFQNRLWWCFPQKAQKGDFIFMYCPRSVSLKKQGIFALCNITTSIQERHEKNYYCTGFGRTGRGRSVLRYADLNYLKGFKESLIAKEIKNDEILSTAHFVRKNFQGTTFELNEIIFNRIQMLLNKKNIE